MSAPTPSLYATSPEEDLGLVLQTGSVQIHFQPLVSLRTKKVMGLEALARGLAPDGRLIPPNLLFETAARQGLLVELDRLCRQKALDAFGGIEGRDPELLLSLNFEAALLDLGVAGSGYLASQVERAGLSPEQVIIEIVESRVGDGRALERFVAAHRERGFLVALDDVGTGHSNLERIAFIKPDVIKLDRGLITGLDREYYKQEVARAVMNLSQRIGALVVGEGVERREEAVAALELGVEILQGYFLARPAPLTCWDDGACREPIMDVAAAFRSGTIDRISRRKANSESLREMVDRMAARLSSLAFSETDEVLEELIHTYSRLECAYVLNSRGIQISCTICDQDKLPSRRQRIFQPAPRGSDQSLKHYYLLLLAGLDKYVSEPYISLASGHLCVTVSTWYKNREGVSHILCADFDAAVLEEQD